MEKPSVSSNRPRFEILNDQQRNDLFLAALECLDRVGVIVKHPPARQVLTQAGAREIDERIFIPPDLVQQALHSAPHQAIVWDRLGTYSLVVGGENVFFGPGPTCTYFHDPQTGERRKAQRGDAGLTAHIVDALENMDYAMSLSLFDDVTAVLSPVYEFAEMVANTSKPIAAWANNPETLQDIFQIAQVIKGSQKALLEKPFFVCFTTYESPLRHSDNQTANMLWAAQHGIPVVCLGGPTVGLESPVTGASALVLYLASVLSGLAIVQLSCPGAPVIIGGTPSVMDLRTARPAYGSPEQVLHTAAAAELAHFLNLPFMGTAGASESKLLDAQAGVEIAHQILVSALSGAGLVHDVGFLDCADIGSLELLVLADEVIAMSKRILRGIEVNPHTIMLDLIEKVGPGGHFLSEPESVALCRQEIWVPKVMDRNAFTIWENKGALATSDRLRQRVSNLLKTHHPIPLPVADREKIEGILASAEKSIQNQN
jgi:trimethylamine--corrinoid protein Co-methyltransferase